VATNVGTVPVGTVDELALVAWREGTRTRAAELRGLNEWVQREREADAAKRHASGSTNGTGGAADKKAAAALHQAVEQHLAAAIDATQSRHRRWYRSYTGARLERAISNLDAAEADLLRVAPPEYVLGQMPSILNLVRRHLKVADPRRVEMERIAAELERIEQRPPGEGRMSAAQRSAVVAEAKLAAICRDQGQIVSAVRGASSAALREQTRLRSFRNVVVVATLAMFVVAVIIGLIGWFSPNSIPMCFAPESQGTTTVVCPTEESGPIETTPPTDVDDVIRQTNGRADVLIIEVLGASAAAIAAATAIRGVRGSSEPYGIPVALAILKLPTGAMTAFLGLLLMRGAFIPGLSALDSPPQILAWAIVFGYAQQLFTRLVDQQAHSVLDDVRTGNKGSE